MTTVPNHGTGKQKSNREKTRSVMLALKIEGSHEPRKQGSLQKLEKKGKELISPLQSPEGIYPCLHLDVSSVRPISDFSPPDLYNNTSVWFCFKLLGLWQLVYINNRRLIQ